MYTPCVYLKFSHHMYILCVTRNDVVAVNMMVQDWKKRGDKSPIRYYKTIQQVNEHTSEVENSPFSKKDFLLVFQTDAQAQMMKENPRTLPVDATHNVTGYNYKLLTIMVIDKNGKGLCGAWAISSRENTFIWNLVVQSLRPEARNIKPEVSMSDDDNAAWNGFRRKTFTSLKHKLLCWWHVDQNVQKHCHGSKCKVQVIYYYNHNFRSYNLCSYVHSVCSYQMFI